MSPGSAALSPSPGYGSARFARRCFSYILTPFFVFSPTAELGPRLSHLPLSRKKRNKKDKRKKSRRESSNVPKSTSCNCTFQGAPSRASTIVPVWLSSSKRPEKEVLGYAILDTQSDSTFILKETLDELDADKQPTKLGLTTITSQESLVDSQRVSGLQVRGCNSDLKIPIAVAYTSTSTPADEDHIPTTASATKWSHLRPIEDKMLDLLDCNVVC